MDNFAFIIHPVNPKRDVQRKFPLLGTVLPTSTIHFLSRFFPPIYISHIVGIQSTVTQNEIEGWFVACPLTPERMLQLPAQVVYKKIIQTGQLAQNLGAKILGLGAFTSVVGDGGHTIAQHLDIPVTTGDSYTVAVAVEALLTAAHQMEVDLQQAKGAVVGAGGAIGRICAQLLGQHIPDLLLIGRRKAGLDDVECLVRQTGTANVQQSTDIQDISQADLIITVSSSIDAIIQPQHLKPGAVICDVARPRDVSRTVVAKRQDVLVIEGGIVEVPGKVNFNFDFGFPQKMVFACMAETIALALEQRYESFTLGKTLSLTKVHEINQIAKKHGFKVAGLRSFEKPITQHDIETIKFNIK